MDADSSREPLRLTADDPWERLSSWLAEGRVDDAAAERARQRWLERQAAEGATVVGVLVDLAERGSPVAVRSAAGRAVRGRVAAVGADFVVVREERLGDLIVPLRSLATVRSAPGEPPVVGDRPASLVIALAEVLVELAADRPLVVISAGGEEVRGELRSAGIDVVAVNIASTRHDVVHIAVESIDHVVLLDR